MKEAVLLKELLVNAVNENSAEGILLSGGLDSSLLAVLSPGMKAITVNLKFWGEDRAYSRAVARFLNMEQIQLKINVDEALEAIPEVIRVLKTFDPAIPNDLAVYFGLKKAKELGIKKVMTGDGADELFAGYSYMRNIKDLEGYIRILSERMYFNSNRLGIFFNIKIKQPYLNKALVDFSLSLARELKIRREKGKIWGKWILRKAFEEILPAKIIWQNKRPLECGSGMSKLREVISSKISTEEFKEAETVCPVKFINKEHFYYYKIYREVVGKIPRPKKGEKKCPGCGAGLHPQTKIFGVGTHCRVCGWVEGKTNHREQREKKKNIKGKGKKKKRKKIDRINRIKKDKL